MSYDVIVVGAGLAGHSAALEAADAGAGVLLLEKQPIVGGSTILSGGSFAFAGTDEQAAVGIDDDSDRLEADFLAVGEHRNDPELVRLYADEQLESYQWLKQRGITFGPIQAASGQSVPRQHPANPREVIRLLNALVESSDRIEVRTGTPVHRLITDDKTGHVEGVTLGPDGAKKVIAERGVVLTSGGFSRNPEMLAQFAPAQEAAKNVGGPGNVGDGIKMAQKLGAGLRDTPFVKGTFGNHPGAGPEEHTAMLGIYRGAIAVNKHGRRFANESISYKLLGDACLAQPGHVAFQILDESIFEDQVKGVPIFDFGRRLEEGLLYTADSLEELAGVIDVPANALKATVERYNLAIEAGNDEFGRTGLVQGFGERKPIAKAPFYAYPSTSAVIATYCGVTVDRAMQVTDVYGDPIPGLFSAGEMTGGFHGAAFMTGTSLGKCVICGRIAGRNATARMINATT